MHPAHKWSFSTLPILSINQQVINTMLKIGVSYLSLDVEVQQAQGWPDRPSRLSASLWRGAVRGVGHPGGGVMGVLVTRSGLGAGGAGFPGGSKGLKIGPWPLLQMRYLGACPGLEYLLNGTPR